MDRKTVQTIQEIKAELEGLTNIMIKMSVDMDIIRKHVNPRTFELEGGKK